MFTFTSPLSNVQIISIQSVVEWSFRMYKEITVCNLYYQCFWGSNLTHNYYVLLKSYLLELKLLRMMVHSYQMFLPAYCTHRKIANLYYDVGLSFTDSCSFVLYCEMLTHRYTGNYMYGNYKCLSFSCIVSHSIECHALKFKRLNEFKTYRRLINSEELANLLYSEQVLWFTGRIYLLNVTIVNVCLHIIMSYQRLYSPYDRCVVQMIGFTESQCFDFW